MGAGSVGLQAVNITQSNSGAHAFPLTLVFRNNYNCMQSIPTENDAKNEVKVFFNSIFVLFLNK